MRKKRGTDKTSLGYCGWYTTKQNNQVYLRSKLEFITAKWLDFISVEYLTERVVYKIDNQTYKPDFFITVNDKLVTIIEVKCYEKDRIKYLEKYKNFFNSIGIKYFVIGPNQLNKITRKYNFKAEIEEWVTYSASIQHDVRGEKNPNFRHKHSDAAKKLIGLKSTERHKDPKYKAWFRVSMKNSFTDERRKELSETQKRIQSTEEYTINHSGRKWVKVSMQFNCVFCRESFTRIALCDKITKDFFSWSGSSYCNDICNKKDIGKKAAETKRKRNLIEKEKAIKLCKDFYVQNKRTPLIKEVKLLFKELKVKDIRTLFGTSENLKREAYGEAVKD